MRNKAIIIITNGNMPGAVNRLMEDKEIGQMIQHVPETISTMETDMMFGYLPMCF